MLASAVAWRQLGDSFGRGVKVLAIKQHCLSFFSRVALPCSHHRRSLAHGQSDSEFPPWPQLEMRTNVGLGHRKECIGATVLYDRSVACVAQKNFHVLNVVVLVGLALPILSEAPPMNRRAEVSCMGMLFTSRFHPYPHGGNRPRR